MPPRSAACTCKVRALFPAQAGLRHPRHAQARDAAPGQRVWEPGVRLLRSRHVSGAGAGRLHRRQRMSLASRPPGPHLTAQHVVFHGKGVLMGEFHQGFGPGCGTLVRHGGPGPTQGRFGRWPNELPAGGCLHDHRNSRSRKPGAPKHGIVFLWLLGVRWVVGAGVAVHQAAQRGLVPAPPASPVQPATPPPLRLAGKLGSPALVSSREHLPFCPNSALLSRAISAT